MWKCNARGEAATMADFEGLLRLLVTEKVELIIVGGVCCDRAWGGTAYPGDRRTERATCRDMAMNANLQPGWKCALNSDLTSSFSALYFNVLCTA